MIVSSPTRRLISGTFISRSHQQEGADLIDNAGTPADQALPYPVQRLQVEPIRGLRRHELHRRSLHRLGDCLGIAEVILLPLRVGANILRRHQPGIDRKSVV